MARRSKRGAGSTAKRRVKCVPDCVCGCHERSPEEAAFAPHWHPEGGVCPGKVDCPKCGARHGKPCEPNLGYHTERSAAAGVVA